MKSDNKWDLRVKNIHLLRCNSEKSEKYLNSPPVTSQNLHLPRTK